MIVRFDNVQTTFHLTGYLVGDIWMPQAECYRPLSYNLTRESARFTSPGTLRDHVLAATSDGDFRSAQIADGYLVCERVYTTRGSNGRVTRTRAWPLSRFPSIADCIKEDWCGPSYND